MSISRFIPILSIIGMAFWALACETPPPPTATHSINSTPSGANVMVNGSLIGVTPIQYTRTLQQADFRKGLMNSSMDMPMTIEKMGYTTINSSIGPSSPGVLHFNLEKKAPTTFTRTMEPIWAGIEVRPELGFSTSWNSILDLLVRRFDLEVISKENGYVRTNWLYTWSGTMNEDYRVRVTVKFAPDHTKLELKTEAQFRTDSGWVLGTDEALLQTLKTDIMGSVGRSTR